MARRPTLPDTKAREAAEKNKPLVEDIRLLGRILGDVCTSARATCRKARWR